jgi:predicted nucleotidyltransferase
VDAAYIFGSHAAGTERPQSDVDLLVIGRPDRVALSEQLAPVESAIGRDVNVVTKSEAQLRDRRRSDDPFWRQVLKKPMVHVLGREIAF